jgi:hypothetical protein
MLRISYFYELHASLTDILVFSMSSTTIGFPYKSHRFSHGLSSIPQCLLHMPPGLPFTNSTFCPHSVFMCFVWISEQRAIILLYSINWPVCITETESVYCAVRTVFMCFVWISEQTAIISLYSINLLVCITETECVYCAVRTEYLSLYIYIHIYIYVIELNLRLSSAK